MKTSSFQSWSEALWRYASVQKDPPSPRADAPSPPPSEWAVVRDFPDGQNTFGDTDKVSFSLSTTETSVLLKEVNAAYNTKIDDILLSALAAAFRYRDDVIGVPKRFPAAIAQFPPLEELASRGEIQLARVAP